jgi:hypothetical protein
MIDPKTYYEKDELLMSLQKEYKNNPSHELFIQIQDLQQKVIAPVYVKLCKELKDLRDHYKLFPSDEIEDRIYKLNEQLKKIDNSFWYCSNSKYGGRYLSPYSLIIPGFINRIINYFKCL